MNNFSQDTKAFLDGELSKNRHQAIQAAISTDSALAEEVRQLEQLSKLLGEATEAFQPIGQQATLDRLETPTAGARPIPKMRYLTWGVGMGLSLLLVIAIVFPPFSQRIRGENSQSGEIQADTASAASAAPATSAPGATKTGPMHGADVKGAGSSWDSSSLQSQSPSDSFKVNSRISAPNTPRQIVRTANLSVNVTNIEKAKTSATQAVKQVNGFVETFEHHKVGDMDSATLAVRVPVDSFDSVVDRFKGLGEVIQESSQGEDVTSQIVDMKARLKTLRAEEEEYRTILGRARTIGQVLEVKQRLNQVRQNIESLDAERANLGSSAQYSRIELSLSRNAEGALAAPPSEGWLNETLALAVSGLRSAVKVLVQFAVIAIVWSIFWLPLLLIVRWVTRRYR